MNIRPEVKTVFDLLHKPQPEPPSGELIQVSTATKHIAFAYERFRNTLEPEEEDILRRKAIYRILERRLFEDHPTVTIATSLIQELIRGNYIKPAPQELAIRLGTLLKKARQVTAELDSPLKEWWLQLVTVAIDRELFPREHEEALVHLMYHDSTQRAEWAGHLLPEDERPVQLYLGCHRTLFAADDNELMHHYFVHQFPAWSKPQLSSVELSELIGKLPDFYHKIQQAVGHSARDRLTRLVRPVAIPYLVLREIITRNGPNAFAAESELEEAARDAIAARIQHTRSRMSKRAWHSILFLFFTKIIIAVLLEFPYESLVLGEVHYLALATNIAFHPLLLFSLATFTRMPGAANTDRIVEQVKKIISGEGTLPTVVLSAPRRYGTVTWSLFAIVYVILFMLIFWGIFTLLEKLGFSLLAMFLFIVFLGLVSFLSTRIRRSADDLRTVPRREGAISAIVSFLSLPVLEFGRWLAQNIRQINVVLFLMDRVLEAPFKLLIDIAEEWFTFVRDRREEIVE